MEFDKDKSFGYPVLRPVFPGEDPNLMDYVRASFEPSVAARIDLKKPKELIVEYEIDFSVPELKRLVEEKTAGLFIDVHCKKTFWSKLFPVEFSGELTIDLEHLRDEIAIHTFLLSKAVVSLNSSKLNPDYAGLDLRVGPNKVLAWCQPTVYTVEKEQFRTVRTIIDYKPTSLVAYGEFTLDTDSDYVSLQVNEEFYAACKIAEASSDKLPALMSGLFTQVVSELIRQIIGDPSGTEEKRWASVLKQKCESKGLTLNEYTFVPQVVEQIMGRPLAKLAKTQFGD